MQVKRSKTGEAKVTSKAVSTGTEAAERVADVLLAFSRGEGSIGVSKLARELFLSKAVVHRILQSLVSRNLVSFNSATREYSLGPSATVLAARALRQLDLRIVARDALAKLRDDTRETTTLSLLVADKRTYVDQYESMQEIKMTVELGRLYPLHAGASSRSILAFLPDSIVEKIIEDGLSPLTEATICDPHDLRQHLEGIRMNGYAISRGERQSGAGSVAAPVFGGDGRVLGAISTCGPLNRFDEDAISRYIPLVASAAARISSEFGERTL